MLTKEKSAQIKKSLVADIRGVLRYLFQGKGIYEGGYFKVGNIEGVGDSKSLLVNLNDGVWQDFATGDKGDIIELWTKKYGTFKIAMNEIHSYLNIPRFSETIEKATKKFTPPKKNWKPLKKGSDVYNYLTIDRKIDPDVLLSCGVCECNDEKGSWYVFVSRTIDGQLCGASYINIEREEDEDTGKSKKIMRQSKNPLSILWGIHDVDHDEYDSVIITEGQIDRMSFLSQGVMNVVSIPMGTGNSDWVAHSWDWLSKFKTIILCFDNDDAGRKFLEVISKKIGLERCKRIELPEKYSDPNDAHQNLFDLRVLIPLAKEFKPSKIVSTDDLVDGAWERVLRGRRELSGIPFCGWESEEDSINFRIRPQEMTIYTGYPGSGKSCLLYQNAASLIFNYDQKVVIASLEEDAEEISMLIAIAAAGRVFNRGDKKLFYKIHEMMKGRLFFYHHRNRAPYADVLSSGEFCIRRYGAQHFIFDSVAKTDLNIEDNEKANEFMGGITTSMNETGAHYHLVAHSRKGDDKSYEGIPGLQEIKGASAFGVETFNCLTVWRNKPKEALMSLGARKSDEYGKFRTSGNKSPSKEYDIADINRNMADTLLIVNKQKVGGHTGQYPLWFNRENYRLKRSFMADDEPYIKELKGLKQDDSDDDFQDLD